MSVAALISDLALGPFTQGVCTALGQQSGAAAVAAVARSLRGHLADPGGRLPAALRSSTGRAWKTLELALAGPSWWERFAAREDRAFRERVRAFLDAAPLPELPGDRDDFRRRALAELRSARDAGRLTPDRADPDELANSAAGLARYDDPAKLRDAEWAVLSSAADALSSEGYSVLAQLLTLRPAGGEPSLLVLSARYFFRREVESDPELGRYLQQAQMDRLNEAQEAGFRGLHEALAGHGERLEALLADLGHDLGGLREDVSELRGLMCELLDRHRATGPVVAQAYGVTIRSDQEQDLVRTLLRRFRALPAEERSDPALLGLVGRVLYESGRYPEAADAFKEAAGRSAADADRAAGHFNAYRAALEANRLGEALAELRAAVALDAERFAPFPAADYELERILGAGGFGVTFLARNRHSGGPVAIKALRADDLDRDVGTVFREAAALEEVQHRAIIRPRHCGYADASRTRPYLVMDYFDGPTLEDYVRASGPLSADDALAVAEAMAAALESAHARGVLHRDVKPANVLVRKSPTADGNAWDVKLIDFGLALRRGALAGALSTMAAGRTVAGASIAGTLDYAAPEQMGKLSGVSVGPAADVYGFGRACCYALFGTPQPRRKDWDKVPVGLAELLDDCVAEDPKERPKSFAEVRERLAQLLRPKVEAKHEAQREPAPRPPREVPIVVEQRPEPAALALAGEPRSRGAGISLWFLTVMLVGWFLGFAFGAFTRYAHPLSGAALGAVVGLFTGAVGGVLWGVWLRKRPATLRVVESGLLGLAGAITGGLLGGPGGMFAGALAGGSLGWFAEPHRWLFALHGYLADPGRSPAEAARAGALLGGLAGLAVSALGIAWVSGIDHAWDGSFRYLVLVFLGALIGGIAGWRSAGQSRVPPREARR